MRFVVIRTQGPGWDRSRAMRQQDYWPEHVEFINRIVDEGRMLLGGPLVNDDPWSTHDVLHTQAIYRWEMLVGEIAAA